MWFPDSVSEVTVYGCDKYWLTCRIARAVVLTDGQLGRTRPSLRNGYLDSNIILIGDFIFEGHKLLNE